MLYESHSHPGLGIVPAELPDVSVLVLTPLLGYSVPFQISGDGFHTSVGL